MKKIITLCSFLMLVAFSASAGVDTLTIAQARATIAPADTLLTYAGDTVLVTGTVYGPNSSKYPTTGLTFWIYNDTASSGIKVYAGTNFGYSVTDGDRVTVQGTLSSYHGSPEIDVFDTVTGDGVTKNASGLPDTAVVVNLTSIGTGTYGQLIQVNNVNMTAATKWGAAAGKDYFTAKAPLVAGGAILYIYVYEYTDATLFGATQPQGIYNVRGIGDYSYYQGAVSANIDPRHLSDFILVDSTTGINEAASRLTAIVYPNPASTQVTVGFGSDINQTVTSKMFDVTGREVLSVTNDAAQGDNELHLNTANLTNGLYILDVRLGEKSMITKIIVNK